MKLTGHEKSLGSRSSKAFLFPGGDKRDRTADLLNAIQALSQLSYTPVSGVPHQNSDYNSKARRKCQEVFQKFFFFSPAGFFPQADAFCRELCCNKIAAGPPQARSSETTGVSKEPAAQGAAPTRCSTGRRAGPERTGRRGRRPLQDGLPIEGDRPTSPPQPPG